MNDNQAVIAVEKYSGVVAVRFVRPEIRNPLSVGVVIELQRIVDRLREEKSVSKLIFTGTGDAFASGADLREIDLITKETAPEFALRGQRLMQSIAELSMQTTAAVNGFCYGGALDLAVACDRRIASPKAEFCHPGVGLGIMTGWSGTQRLPLLIGEAKALEIFLTAKRFDAKEALDCGLIDEISDDPVKRALELN